MTRPDAATQRSAAVLHHLDDLDRAVYAAIASTPTPGLDGPMRRLSAAANNSGIWLAISAVLIGFGGRPGRRAAAAGVIAIGCSSALVNLGAKALSDRPRPDRSGLGTPPGRYVRMPASTSFPSGHSASAFAFASAAGREVPFLSVPLRALAAAVAYSRVHTGVHYPADVVAGSIVGAWTGTLVARLIDRASG
jgi:membrane-associated phospholipid phosphatase